jgi:hypothetical protein
MCEDRMSDLPHSKTPVGCNFNALFLVATVTDVMVVTVGTKVMFGNVWLKQFSEL